MNPPSWATAPERKVPHMRAVLVSSGERMIVDLDDQAELDSLVAAITGPGGPAWIRVHNVDGVSVVRVATITRLRLGGP